MLADAPHDELETEHQPVAGKKLDTAQIFQSKFKLK